ncbi:monocarboxylate transporter [Xylaria arbuscula]|nr:monocarboxylate transporter [Xylaria arbuscula]
MTTSSIIANSPQGEADSKHHHSRGRYAAIILSAFLINFTACGLLFGFGDYQALYESMILEEDTPFTGSSFALIDLIGTLSVSLMTIGAPITVTWAKHFKPRLVIYLGGLLFGLAHVLASFGTRLWHFQLTQGLLLGIGTCLSFIPSMTVAPSWFEENRGLAMGIISSGTGFGGLVWAPVLTASFDQLGFRNTLRLTGSLATLLICPSGFLSIPLPTWKMICKREFVAQALSTIFQSAAYYIPVFFIASYAKALGYNSSGGANLTAISNATNAIGKVAVGFIADRIGRLNSFFITTFLTAAVTLGLWVPSTLSSSGQSSNHLFISFTVLYGLLASAYISLFPAALIELFGLKDFPRIAGVMYLLQGSATLVGTPVAGALIGNYSADRSSRDYLPMAALVGALMLAASAAAGWVRMEATYRHGREGGWRWQI